MSFDTDDVLYFAGDKPNGVFGLVSGSLQIAVPRADGQECLFYRAETGFWVGDLALFSGQSRLVTARVSRGTRVVRLPQGALAALLERHPELIKDFYDLSFENTRTALQLLGNLTVTGAENRIALRLLMHAETLGNSSDWINLSQDTLALMVAVSEKTVRRSLRELHDRGLIETSYSRLRIIDQEGLASLCGYSRPQ